jgi:hypothetical protein
VHSSFDRVGTPTHIRHLPSGWWLSGGAHPQLEVPLGDISPAVGLTDTSTLLHHG